MNTDPHIARLSKMLSYYLRHHPEAIGLIPDAQGWVTVQALLEALQQKGTVLDLPLLNKIVAENNKQRFALSDDLLRIRASQGHSFPVQLEYAPQIPPPVLYHGTATRFWESIQQQGLTAQQRHHVHLSATIETAQAVGARHGKPVVLQVDAAAMHEAGFEFFCTPNQVWLTATVPPNFLKPL